MEDWLHKDIKTLRKGQNNCLVYSYLETASILKLCSFLVLVCLGNCTGLAYWGNSSQYELIHFSVKGPHPMSPLLLCCDLCHLAIYRTVDGQFLSLTVFSLCLSPFYLSFCLSFLSLSVLSLFTLSLSFSLYFRSALFAASVKSSWEISALAQSGHNTQDWLSSLILWSTEAPSPNTFKFSKDIAYIHECVCLCVVCVLSIFSFCKLIQVWGFY